MDKPEVKSGIVLPPKISELRRKLAHKAKQEPEIPVLRSVRPDLSGRRVADCGVVWC